MIFEGPNEQFGEMRLGEQGPPKHRPRAGVEVFEQRHRTQVAEWAGHSVEVLLRVYAKCIAGQQDEAKRRILQATQLSATSTKP